MLMMGYNKTLDPKTTDFNS